MHTVEALSIPDPLTAEEAEQQEQWFGSQTFKVTFGFFQVPETAYAAMDASGGANIKDPRIRRCGWAFIIFDDNGEILFGVMGPKGETQTVNSAELHGLLRLLKYTQGYYRACTDSYYVYNHFCKGRRPFARRSLPLRSLKRGGKA